MEPTDDAVYAFEALPTALPQWTSTDVKAKLMQWNLDEHGCVGRFRPSCPFDPRDDAAFLRCFFESQVVRDHLSLPASTPTTLDGLLFERLATTVTSMAFFDKLANEPDLVSSGGYLRKCYDEVYEHCTVSDGVREMMANGDSEHAHLFTAAEQRELIFQIFKRLVIGGAMCQSDETIQPYLDITKAIYKALAAVRKGPQGDVHVYSHVYLFTDKSTRKGGSLFQKLSPFNACFVAVDPKKQAVQCWYVPYVPFW
ncbi:hypothetical protein SDRG_11971 [Saprolegnia diclina VS20]|uniref:Cilia- and flagella-associated protein 300 n=1 Tax=Saprolegnia diclina (strain VS20) TaxID=1156394 RepID=T0Q719_SAPDV|nr:hypothetical protein SDRG_11971 [Saprolegnia diclina VS20]EQC30396.1 hypothetical protein SDRG_11971 [Saprolegnia diclina VS20]|eukprot:XP_008616249.1 hypothetical protein SDRG_11971 [Saprolegnia diclina VS20]